MESLCGISMQSFTWAGSERIRMNSNGFIITHHRINEESPYGLVRSSCSVGKSCLTSPQKHCGYIVSRACKSSQGKSCLTSRQKHCGYIVSLACKSSQVPALNSEIGCASLDGTRILKKRAEDVASQLNGRCLFLVGMMGSGKTTVGKVLSDALGYSFVDSDNYVEQALGKLSVAQIFQQCGESRFRDHESEALGKLSMMPRLVVATGGGAVVRPINWKHMKQGVSVYLDAPLDALARRIASVGTGSRPLLHYESGDAYTTAFTGLFTLSKKRAEGYSNADTTVSLQHIASKSCLEDVLDITPTTIAIEVLDQIEKHLKCKSGKCIQMLP